MGYLFLLIWLTLPRERGCQENEDTLGMGMKGVGIGCGKVILWYGMVLGR